MLRVTCDNASANEHMVENLAKLVLEFPRGANRAQCLAHIVNLVVKLILRQFDMSKKKGRKTYQIKAQIPKKEGCIEKDEPKMTEGDVDELVRPLDKEEMYKRGNEDDEESEKVKRDVKQLEMMLEGEIKEVLKLAKPVCQVLYKVSLSSFFFFLFLIAISLYFFVNTRLPSFFLILLFTHHLSSSSFCNFFYFLFHP